MVAALFWLFLGMIVYTYAGYPLLLALIARFKRQRTTLEGGKPAVTLLIAAYNEQAVIADKIANSFALDYPREAIQILVAADGSDDKTPEIVRSYERDGVELSYSTERRGKMAAINNAMPEARGEIVVFTDANNMYDSHTLRELVRPFGDQDVGAVTGAKLITRGGGVLGAAEGAYWKYESFIKTQETRLGSCTGVAGEILAIRRELFEPPPRHIINDDFFMAMQVLRRGYRVVYEPSARSYEAVSVSAQDEGTRRARIVAGRYQIIANAHRILPLKRPLIVWQIISHKFLRPVVPFAMIGALLTNVAAVVWPTPAAGAGLWRLSPPVNWILLALQILFYSLAWIGNRWDIKGLLGRFLYLPTFLVNSNMAALVGFIRFVTGQHSALWERVERREVDQSSMVPE